MGEFGVPSYERQGDGWTGTHNEWAKRCQHFAGDDDVVTLLSCLCVCPLVLGPRVSQFLTSSVLQYPTHHPLLLPLFHIALLGSLLLFMKWQERVALLIIECYFYFSPLRVTISISERISFHVSRSFLFLVFLALDKEFSLLKNFAASAP